MSRNDGTANDGDGERPRYLSFKFTSGERSSALLERAAAWAFGCRAPPMIAPRPRLPGDAPIPRGVDLGALVAARSNARVEACGGHTEGGRDGRE
ncbi:uncharacterized protein MICPUCDRAFT_59094 [Micromonas pusilla CCMP1545]|jgi:hypothetical protein|uniref:Predicted protein n=1 Tax=Micromonas pusilla (strain CCMP1545) TaxID=564608 RepID=C1MV86_MICPC|nr:uncharacterized protein MICPUCDRAFT_59094 [Micromonas pusilla CCMP1545]EEH56461.1 predicted protein [Micromonas pusilla CCMP1545]|eukprot:XP_003059329.1 predicted protein [Micromonas pusilla CCMP1545]